MEDIIILDSHRAGELMPVARAVIALPLTKRPTAVGLTTDHRFFGFRGVAQADLKAVADCLKSLRFYVEVHADIGQVWFMR